MTKAPSLRISGVAKRFMLHQRNGLPHPVLAGAQFEVAPGECVGLAGPSGAGKSSLLKMIYGTYRCFSGCIEVRTPRGLVDVARADPRTLLALRSETVGYVTQFLRVIPRVATVDIVADPLRRRGAARAEASQIASELLSRVNIPEHLWLLPPATFSGGEQQRVNIARGFAYPYPILLLDEPTASLDAGNRAAVISLIADAKARGAAVLCIFHDADVRERVIDRIVDVTNFQAAA